MRMIGAVLFSLVGGVCVVGLWASAMAAMLPSDNRIVPVADVLRIWLFATGAMFVVMLRKSDG